MNAVGAVATAPGKAVVLGEYAVLEGAPALVLAVNRRCHAQIGPTDNTRCRLRCTAETAREFTFEPGAPSGAALVDRVVQGLPGGTAVSGWAGVLDSSRLYSAGRKLGLGSSAAALTAWSGAWMAWSGRGVATADATTLRTLVGLHRAYQGGAGSGLDVAASLHGGVIRYRLDANSDPQVSAARLPTGVVITGVFAGSSASTREHVARYRACAAAAPAAAAARVEALGRVARGGIGCAAADDTDGFLRAVREYSDELETLGEWMGKETFTPEHRHVKMLAERFGVAYKVSGAGGGDLGLAFSADPVAMARFRKVADERYDIIEIVVDPLGLTVETIGQ